MDISIIIVNYNSNKLLYNCINSLLTHINNIDFEIVIVDNNSTDNSLNLCKTICSDKIVIVEAKENLGFSRANNLGVKHSSGDILHFLNPDTEVDHTITNDYIQILNDFHNNVQQVYVTPMKDIDGTVYYGKNFIPDTFNYLTYLFCRPKTKWYYIGATVILPRSIFNLIGGWNNDIFMYEEDSDLFFKINKYTIPIIEMPAIIFHYGGGTSKNAFSNIKREILIQKSLRIYFKSNKLSIFNYFAFEILMLLSFLRRPKRALWQLKAIIKSFC